MTVLIKTFTDHYECRCGIMTKYHKMNGVFANTRVLVVVNHVYLRI